MSGHTSQNAPTRKPAPCANRARRTLLPLLGGLAFLAGVLLAVDRFPDTLIGRTIGMHLGQLADPRSWTP